MASSRSDNNNPGNQQSRSQRRRDTENAVFSELADLLPISQDIKQDKLSVLRLTVAYLKLQGGLATDEQDLEECLATAYGGTASPDYDLDTYSESRQPPLALLDNDGNLIAGSLLRDPARKEPANITLPDKILSELEEQFLSGYKQPDDIHVHTRKEELQKYKEGLEKGMQEFLNQDLSDIQCHYNQPARTAGHKAETENTVCLKSSKVARNAGTRQANSRINKENRLRKVHTKSENNLITNTPCSSVVSERNDQLLTISKLEQESSFVLEAAGGFIMSLDKDKRVLFVTENVSDFLGHCQLSVIGQDVCEFIYEKDYPELERQMSNTQFQGGDAKVFTYTCNRVCRQTGNCHVLSSHDGGPLLSFPKCRPPDESGRVQPWQIRRTFYMAMKFSFQKSGSRMRDSGCQLYQWIAKLSLYKDKSSGDIHVKGLTSLCCPLQRDPILSFSEGANVFLMRFSIKDSKILYCDPKVQDLLGYNPSDLVGVKHTDLKHPSDTVMCKYNYKNLRQDRKTESGYYRMLSRVGIWVWLYTSVNIIYNKHGEAEILVMRNIIVSQAEARCVLSREKKDFERIQNLGYSVDLFNQPVSQPTIASIAFNKGRKRNRVSLDTVPTVGESSAVQSTPPESLCESTSLSDLSQYWDHLLNETIRKHEMQKSYSQPQPSKNLSWLPHKIQETATGSAVSDTDTKQKSVRKVFRSSSIKGNTDKISDEGLVYQSEDTVMDSYQGVDSSSLFVSSMKNLFNITDSDSSIEMPFSQKMIVGTSLLGTCSSSSLQLSSSEQEWSLDSLLLDNGLQDNSLLALSSRSQTSTLTDSYILSEKTTHDTRGKNSVKFASNDQQVLVQTITVDPDLGNAVFQYSSQLQASPRQPFSELLMSDEHSLSGDVDVLADEPLPSTRALLLPSSGDVMLSFLTAPKPIICKPGQQNQNLNPPFNMTGRINLVLETKNKSKEEFSSNLASDTGSSSSSFNPADSNDHIASAFTTCPVTDVLTHDSLLCNPLPVVSELSDILYSPGKLDYPPLKSMLTKHQGKSTGTFHDNFQQTFQISALNSATNRDQTQALDTSCRQGPRKNHIQTLTKPTSDKILQGSVVQAGYDSSVNSMMSVSRNERKQSLNFTSKATTDMDSLPSQISLSDFCDDLFQDMTGHDAMESNAFMGDNNISEMKHKNNLASDDRSEGFTRPDECVDSATNLPADLVDLELDSEIVVGLGDNWVKYL